MPDGLQNGVSEKFRKRVLVPGALVLLMTAILCGGALIGAGRSADNLSLEAQKLEVWREFSNAMDELSLGQEALALCDECIAKASAAKPDEAWLHENVGERMHSMYGADANFILDSSDKPVLASVEGRRASLASYELVAPSIERIVDLARGRTTRPGGTSNLNERLPGSPSQPLLLPPVPGISDEPVVIHPTVRTSADAIHSTDLVRVGERLAAVSAMRMARSSGNEPFSGAQAPLLVSLRYLDGTFLAEVNDRNFISQPRLSQDVEPRDGEVFTPVMDSENVALANLFWKPHLGGSAVIESLLLPAGLMFAVVTILVLLMALRMGRLIRKDFAQVDELRLAHHNLESTLRELETTHAELMAKEAQAHQLAYHDVLTGLPNRALFNDDADKALVQARHGDPSAIALLDLDRFKNVNDRFGHLAGDALIEEVAQRLTKLVERPDAVARLGGDEFAILFGPKEVDAGLEAILDRVLESLQRPFEVLGNEAHIGASIGVAVAPRDGLDRGDLMRKADIALYRAKEEGRACYRFFTSSMDETVQLRAGLEAELRSAIASGTGLKVYYQPLIEAGSAKVGGFEALLRWDHPTRGLIAPQLFVPVAEETGLIHPLGEWVIEQACEVAREWPQSTISINLSPVQFCDEAFAERVCALVHEAGVRPGQIELEVTEGVVLDQNEMVRGALRHLRSEGFRIALDDFGTGYSSLSYLRDFEVDRIKIDKSFVHGLGKSLDAAAIVTAVVTLGHAIGLQVTAEGVETADQESFLNSTGCNMLQGFLFSEAVPAEELRALIREKMQGRKAA